MVATVADAPTADPEGHSEAAGETASAEIDEIWRPSRRKEAHRAKRAGAKPPRKDRSKAAKRQPHHPQAEAKREQASAAIEHSPFAALKELRQSLVARRTPKQS